MKDLKSIASELSKGKNPKENLELYVRGISSMYNALAYIKLSMNYYTVYDMNSDMNNAEYKTYADMYGEFGDIVGKLLHGELTAGEVENFRARITHVMEVVFTYIDELRIYEHILNRIEYRFKESEFDPTYYNTYFTNDLMHYILSDKDNVVINGKIANVIGQLPVRISKNSFYEHIKDAFSLYHGAQKGSIDDFRYSLATSTLLKRPDGMDEIFPDMQEIVSELKNADYDSLGSEEFDRLYSLLEAGAQKMNDCADSFVLMASMVNDIYTIVLSDGLGLGENTEVNLAKDIVSRINEAQKGVVVLSDDIASGYVEFEGKQERILDVISGCDYVIHEFPQSHESELEAAGMTEAFKTLAVITKLQSGSEFVALHADEDFSEIPDNSYADEVCESLINDLSDLFEGASVRYRRAVMSTVLTQLPVFFNNTEELQSYINISLMQCSDRAEQTATVEILKSLMNE